MLNPVFEAFGPLVDFLKPPGTVRRRHLAAPPTKLIELFSYEGCPACRKVRRMLTELDLDYVHRSCPRGESPKRKDLRGRGGKVQVPFMVDPNTNTQLYESADIVRYLLATYGPRPLA